MPSKIVVAVATALLLCLAPASALASTTARASVVGGSEADPAAWPFVVALVKTDQADTFQAQFCGGAVVAERVVVTAAHCVMDLPDSSFEVVTGGRLSSGQARLAVQTVATHPAYRGGVGAPHDLAILTLAQPLGVSPIPLADAGDDQSGQTASVAGWGNVEGNGGNLYPATLVQGDLVLGGDLCRDAVYDRRWILCGGALASREASPCSGDSGGPLVSNGKLVGVVSFGPAHCHAESYYARVSAERAFLDAAISGRRLPESTRFVTPLSLREARRHVAVALRRRFGRRFTTGRDYRASCRRRSELRVRCSVRWALRQRRYRGSVTITAVDDATVRSLVSVQ